MDDLSGRVPLQKHYIGLCLQYIVSVYACVCRLSRICVCAPRTEHPKMWDIFVPPIRGCAHVKVYLKSFNEAWSNGSWSCRHTSLTLFHWRQWGRRERGVVPSDLATVEKKVKCIWAKVPRISETLICLKLGSQGVCQGSRGVKEAFYFLSLVYSSCLYMGVALLAQMIRLFFARLPCLFLRFLFGSLLLMFPHHSFFFPSLNPVHYLVWARLPDASGEVCGWLLWFCHGWHWM